MRILEEFLELNHAAEYSEEVPAVWVSKRGGSEEARTWEYNSPEGLYCVNGIRGIAAIRDRHPSPVPSVCPSLDCSWLCDYYGHDDIAG